MNPSAKGQCLCGAVNFTAIFPTRFVAHCHCSQCQRSHGAGVVTWAGVVDAQFLIDTGESSLTWYQSSAAAQRGFCNVCGSSLFFRSSNWPGEIHIAAANFIDALDRSPQAHVFYESHVAWLTLADSLPRKTSS